MKATLILTLVCYALAGVALAQQASSTAVPPPPPAGVAPPPSPTAGAKAPAPESPPSADSQTPETATADTQGARETPLDAQSFDGRVHRRLAEYNQRRQQRELEMGSYNKVSASDPSLGRFADPRKVQVEIQDELDREQTSEQLANDYAEQAREVQSKQQALQEFITKRRKTIDDLSKQNVTVNPHDLELALANLAHQPDSPETQAQMREFDRRLSEAERAEKDVPARTVRAQQEVAGATEELAKLQALEQSLQKESKAFAADALSASQNRLGLADRLEYYVVRDQAEDVLEQGREATESVQHLSASPEVESTLDTAQPKVRSDVDLQQLKTCIQQSGDVMGCHEKARPAN
jgi:hypothetical protein